MNDVDLLKALQRCADAIRDHMDTLPKEREAFQRTGAMLYKAEDEARLVLKQKGWRTDIIKGQT